MRFGKTRSITVAKHKFAKKQLKTQVPHELLYFSHETLKLTEIRQVLRVRCINEWGEASVKLL